MVKISRLKPVKQLLDGWFFFHLVLRGCSWMIFFPGKLAEEVGEAIIFLANPWRVGWSCVFQMEWFIFWIGRPEPEKVDGSLRH